MKRICLAIAAVLVVLMPFCALAHAQSPIRTLQPSTTAAIVNGTTTKQASISIENYPYLAADVLINITGGGAVTGTMQLFLQDSADGGTTWDDLLSSNTFAFGAAPITQHFFLTFDTTTTATQGGAAATETLAAGTVRQGPIGSVLRVREKISAIAGSPTGPTYTITAVMK